MRVRRWIAAIALGLAMALPSAGSAQDYGTTKEKADAKTHKTVQKTKKTAEQSGAAISDASITTKIKADFVNEKTLEGSNIDVDTNNHVVTLKGTVASRAGKARAQQIAKTTKGVTRVVNDLMVTPAKDKAGTGGTMDRAGEKTKDAASKAVEKTKEATGTAGEAITDAWITTKIKADFVNEDALKGSDINVDTNNHVVTLKGTVASLAGKSRAEQIARSTKGVTRVINTLTITAR